MSYVSLLKTIPDFLSQPAGIAVMASVGIHGVIAFLLPLMPMETKTTKEVKTPKTVGLVELKQADRQRLPQTNPATKTALNLPENKQGQVPLPEFALKTTPLPTLAPPSPSTQVLLPPLPKPRANLVVDPLPKTTSNSSFRIRPTDRFQIRPSVSTSARQIAFKDPGRNSNPRPTEISPRDVNPQINAGKGQKANNLQNSNLPNLNPAALPSGLPNNPVQAAGITSVRGLPPSINEVSRNSSVKSEVTNNISSSTQNQRVVTPVGEPKAIDRLAFANGSQVPNSKVQSPNKVITEAELFAKVKQQIPNIEVQAVPLQPRLDLPQGEKATNIKGSLVVDDEGRIDFFELLDKSVSSNLKVAVRDHFRNYFQKNSVKTNGKPKYVSFNVVFEPSNGQPSPSASQSLRERLGTIRDNRELKSNPSPAGEASNPEKSSSVSPLSIQSVIRTELPSDRPRSNQQKSPSDSFSQRLRGVAVNSKDDSGNNNQVLSSSQEDQRNLIQRLRTFREERKASDSK